jgi:hypothetical protein
MIGYRPYLVTLLALLLLAVVALDVSGAPGKAVACRSDPVRAGVACPAR